MALNIIGIGMKDENSVTLEGLELIKKSDSIYLEIYTSILTDAKIENLEKFYGKEIIKANRELVEKRAEDTILKDAKEKETSFLVIGDPFSATTHMDILQRAKEENIEVRIINNVSILTAIGIVGLELYKYGKVTSIPFDNENVNTPFNVYQANKGLGMHTLFLLDLRPEENRFMSAKEAINFLISKGLDENTKVISCAQIGGKNPIIKTSLAKDAEQINSYPQCLIIPGELHFVEEELIEKWN